VTAKFLDAKVQELPWIDVLTQSEICVHREAATIRRFARGDVLIHEQTPAESVYAVIEGALAVEKRQPSGTAQIVGFLFPKDTSGVVHGSQYTYTVRCLVDTEALVLPRAVFERLCEDSPRMQRAILQLASNELVAAQDHLVLLGRKTASERLASFLLNLEKRCNGAGDACVWLPMRRSDIANHLGLTLETVSRLFSDFEKRGLLARSSLRAVQIADRAALKYLAEGE